MEIAEGNFRVKHRAAVEVSGGEVGVGFGSISNVNGGGGVHHNGRGV
jgi:hypothetical protein